LFFYLELIYAIIIVNFEFIAVLWYHRLHSETNAKNRDILSSVLILTNDIIKYFESLSSCISLISFLILNVVERTRDKYAIYFIKHFFHFFVRQILFNWKNFSSALFDKFYIVKWNLLIVIVGNHFWIFHDIVNFVYN